MQRAETLITLKGPPLYFAMIAQMGWHSFIIIGATDSQTKRNHILFAAGKCFKGTSISYFSLLGRGIPSSLQIETSIFANVESGEFTQKAHSISYKAYRIKQEDYVNFLRSLCTLQHAYMAAYVPRVQDEAGLFPFIYTPLYKTEMGMQPRFVDGLDFITFSKKSCRISAIEILLAILKLQEKDKDVSSSFYRDLPYKNSIFRGEVLHLIYALPLPPTQQIKNQHPFGEALQLIYARLCEIPTTSPDQEITFRKFDALKALYDALSEADTDLSAWARCLQDWNLQYSRLINTHRGQVFSDDTATAKTVQALFKLLTIRNRLDSAV